MTEVMDVIRDLINFIREESGIELHTDIARKVEARACSAYGGERLYLPKLPKLQSQQGMSARRCAVLQASTQTSSTKEIAASLGISQRRVRQILNGK